MRIVFLGSADFGIPALQALEKEHIVTGIVSKPPRPMGRGLKCADSPVVAFARKENIAPVFTPEALDDPLFIESIRSLKADCFVVVAFRLLPRSVFSLPPFGTLNIHGSLLPAYRGPAPIHRAIEAGETKSGVTVFRIDDGIDTGEILEQAEVTIAPEETTPELYLRLSSLGARCVCSALAALEQGESTSRVQSDTAASKAPKLKKSEAVINWELSAVAIFNKIRAFKPFPGTVTFIDNNRLGIEWALPLTDCRTHAPAGTVITTAEQSFDVQTSDGVLRVLYVKPEGRRSMTAGDYLRGARLEKGFRFHE